jgi:hypothetical protein
MEKVTALGLPNGYRLSNGTVEAIVTTDVGPRIIHYGFCGGENILGEAPDVEVKTDYGVWKARGGHRLWHAPEEMPRTYVPDNDPVECEALGDRSVRLTQPVEVQTGVQKEMRVSLDASGTRLMIEHRLTNRNMQHVTFAPWGLTIMDGEEGGCVILPQEPYRSHDECLQPARTMTLWAYTDLSDPRWTLGKNCIRLRVDPAAAEPQKLGLMNRQGWAAYARKNELFVTRFPFCEGAKYPDGMANCETYTAGAFVEIETLGALQCIMPGQSARHVEEWHLFADVEIGGTDDAVEAALGPLVADTERKHG